MIKRSETLENRLFTKEIEKKKIQRQEKNDVTTRSAIWTKFLTHHCLLYKTHTSKMDNTQYSWTCVLFRDSAVNRKITIGKPKIDNKFINKYTGLNGKKYNRYIEGINKDMRMQK